MVTVDLLTLRSILARIELINSSYQLCIDWAVSELIRGVDDEDVCILASSNINNMDEVRLYLKKILRKDLFFSEEELEEVAGQIILEFGQQYFNGKIDVIRIESIIDKLYVNLKYPNWLVILSRNAEYAIDIEAFLKPFESELEYIMDLWKQFTKHDNFIKQYSRDISNSHEF